MEIQEETKLVIEFLKYTGIEKETILFAGLVCEEPETALDMLEYLMDMYQNKEEITNDKVIKKLLELSGTSLEELMENK